MNDTEVRRCVQRGAAFLDEHSSPHWARYVHIETLHMNDAGRCVLGQLCGSYGEGCEEYGLTVDDEYRYGFEYPAGIDRITQMATLTRLWRGEITKRQQKG